MADKVIFRKDVPENRTCDLYASGEDMYRDAEKMKELGGEM